MLTLVGLCVLAALRLVYRGVRPADDQVHLALRAIGWTLTAIGGLAALELVVGPLLGPFFWFDSLLVAGIMLHRYRLAEQNALLAMLAIAAEKQVPLADGVEAFADEWGGQFGNQATSFARLLRTGLPLADCMERERGLVSPTALLIARVGTEVGMLGPALREEARSNTVQQPAWQTLATRIFYLFSVLFVAQTTLVFMLLQVLPKLSNVFAGFTTQLPAATQWLLDLSVSTRLVQVSIVVLVVELLILLYFTLSFLGLAPWGVPILDRFTRRLDTVVLLRAFAWTTQRQLPLVRTIDLLARWHPKFWVRRKLAGTQRDLALGIGWRDSLRSRGLIGASDAAVLAAAERVGNLTWALRELADSGERRLAYRLQGFVQWLYPFVIIWLGLLAYAFVTAYFLPLVQAIEAASQ